MNGPLALLAAYLIGAIPFGYLLVRLKSGQDVREFGSGNIGATNVLRNFGRAAGVLTLVLDMLKGLLAVWLAGRLTGQKPGWMAAAALVAMLGHSFPVFLRFRGGKAVATWAGAFGYLTPLPMIATLLLLVIVVAVTRYVSLASLLAVASLPLALWLILHPGPTFIVPALLAAVVIVWRHRANIERLRDGTERKFRWGRG